MPEEKNKEIKTEVEEDGKKIYGYEDRKKILNAYKKGIRNRIVKPIMGTSYDLGNPWELMEDEKKEIEDVDAAQIDFAQIKLKRMEKDIATILKRMKFLEIVSILGFCMGLVALVAIVYR